MVIRKHLLLIAVFVSTLAPALSVRADQVRIWEADTGLGGITDKTKIKSYLDNLKAHSVTCLWVQVELYSEGTVNYKKTTLSRLPTAEKFKTGQWANDDFLSYVIAQAKARDMKVTIKFHGSNRAAWDKHPDWRKMDSHGKEVLWGGTLRNFCVNSPYWETMFLPMVREIAQNYDIDGLYLDTAQVAYEQADACFCRYCKERFEKETGKTLPPKSVDSSNWTVPLVKEYAIKRVEWVNRFYEEYGHTIRELKPNVEVLLNASGEYNSYKDTVSARHVGAHVTTMTPETVNTPRMYAVVTNRARVKAKEKPKDEGELALDEIVPAMNRYGYLEFTTKLMLADGGFEPVVPFSRYWFTDDSGMGPVDLEIKQIESAIGGGAKGWCFFGYLANALDTGKAKSSAWSSPKFISYLKDLATGPRSKWIAEMRPDSRMGILIDRNADFWTGDYWNRFKHIGRLYSFLQDQRKLSVGLIATSEPDAPGFGQSGYRLTKEILSQYKLVICPGLDYASVQDFQALKDYYDAGGKLIIMGPIGGHGKFLGGSVGDEAYRLLGLCTVGEGEPSGFLQPVTAKSPVFMGVRGTFRYADDKYAALSYNVKFSDAFEVWANEFNDAGKRPAFLYTKAARYDPAHGSIAYVNSDQWGEGPSDLWMVMNNLIVVVPANTDDMFTVHFSQTSSVNAFKSADGMTRYVHIFTLDGEDQAQLRIRANPNTYPISAEIITNGGSPKPITISMVDRLPMPGEMTTVKKGNGILRPGHIPPGWAMIKIVYEHRDYGPGK